MGEHDDLKESSFPRERGRKTLWPSPQEYNEALQCPAIAFVDAELMNCTIETTELGLPRPNTGMFASVYQVHANKSWAVRCFLHNITDQPWRYAKLHETIQASGLPYFVDFEYQRQGIRCNNSLFPILKMEWCEGDPLDRWIEKNLLKPRLLHRLAEKWWQMAADLRSFEIAHGDLQHSNVFVLDGEIKLVDYDGMFVPSLQQMGARELGHPAYQHPGRSSSDYGSYLDNFSMWVIYGVLECLLRDHQLWQQLRCGEDKLFFCERDLKDPTRSRSFQILENHDCNEVRTIGRLIRYFLTLPMADTPPLGQFDITSFDPEQLPPLQTVSAEEFFNLALVQDLQTELSSTARQTAPASAEPTPAEPAVEVVPIVYGRATGNTALRIANTHIQGGASAEMTWIAIFGCLLLPIVFFWGFQGLCMLLSALGIIH